MKTEIDFLIEIAIAAQCFCQEVQEDAEGVPQVELNRLNDALDAWEEDYTADTGICHGPTGPRERGA